MVDLHERCGRLQRATAAPKPIISKLGLKLQCSENLPESSGPRARFSHFACVMTSCCGTEAYESGKQPARIVEVNQRAVKSVVTAPVCGSLDRNASVDVPISAIP